MRDYTTASHTMRSRNLAGLTHLLVVYLVWGSTYLAIRIAVQEGSGFPPFTMGAMRLLIAGAVILLFARVRGASLRPRPGELFVLAASGLLLWLGGNGLVTFAEQRAASGYSALLMGTVPIWVAMMEAGLDRKAPSWRLMGALVVALTGMGLLSVPSLSGRTAVVPWWVLVLLVIAPVSWALGSVVQHRKPVALSPVVSSGYQQIFGGLGFLGASAAAGESMPHPTVAAWWAWGYLVVFGSLLAYTSFVAALKLLPTAIVMTYAYVNPVIAVGLGWLMLGETITGWTISGTALILLGLVGVFQSNRKNSATERIPGEVKHS